MTEQASKPPIGIYPKVIWIEQRCRDLVAAINRYNQAGFASRPEWIEELAEHERWLQNRSENEQAAETRPLSLSDAIEWSMVPLCLRQVIVIRSRSGMKPNTYRELLTIGRSMIVGFRWFDQSSIKTLDDEFAARNCPEWLTS